MIAKPIALTEGIRLPDVTDDEQATIAQLLKVWQARLSNNMKRSLYYDGEQPFKDLGLTLPPQLKNAKFALGWAAMAVRKTALRSQFDGVKHPRSADALGLDGILADNDFALEFSQAVASAYKHGCSFVTVAGGDDRPVQIHSHSAEAASALWDSRSRAIRAGMTITDTDDHGRPIGLNVYLPDYVLICRKDGSSWSSERIPNRIGRTLMVRVTHDPQILHPFGRSRITKPVMALTDMAVRGYVRMEANAEFYSSPQIAIEGLDPSSLGDGSLDKHRFELAMDRLIAVSPGENDIVPTIKQLQQATMTPHSEMIRTVALAFSGETGIPPSSLGVIHDNPSSAEAIRAAEHDLLIDVTYHNRVVHAQAVRQIAELALMVADNTSQRPADVRDLSVSFIDPEFRSVSANADAVVKLATLPQLQGSNVLLEQVFDSDQIARIEADQRRAAGNAILDILSQPPSQAVAEPPEDEQ